MGRQHYLCKKVQPGEIARGDLVTKAEQTRILANAADIVRRGVFLGLMSYPAGTTFDNEGSPIAAIQIDDHTTKKGVEAYPCLRAFLMKEAGATYRDIAREIKCSVGYIKPIIDHGRAIHARHALSGGLDGVETAEAQEKRATVAGNDGAGHCKQETMTKTAPRGGNPTDFGVKRGGQSRPKIRRD